MNMKLNEKRIVNDIRLLALDMIDTAGSGHPGIALDIAPTLYTLFAYHLKFDLERKAWCNRDRFVLSAGHGSAILYSTMYYLLDEYNLDELKNFRRISSVCTGHPEYNLNNRIEVTSGPLGQGFATSVGMAIGEKYLESTFNRKKNTVFNYNIYTLVSDGDLMEGISYEAASLAGNLGLDNLIVLYDSNGVTADGDLDKAMYENIPDRFTSMNWEVIVVKDGENIGEISNAIEKAKKSKKPVLIEIKTKLGKYSKYEGTNRIHSNLDKEDLEQIRTKLKEGPAFTYSEEDRNAAIKFIKDGTEDYYREWYSEYEMYIANSSDEEKDKINLVIENEKISLDIDAVVDASKIFEDKTMRDINYQIMNVIGTFIPNFMGGSADLFCSTKTYLKGKEEFSVDNYAGRNINFGVRENLMGAILNGLALTNIRSYGSTFLAFSNYMMPSIRMSAMMDLPVTYIFTHDSIRVGEDGPTHEPVEQLTMLRAMPNMYVFRPCDEFETKAGWYVAMSSKETPTSLILSRQDLPKMVGSNRGALRGGYIIDDCMSKPDIIIIASGSEVDLAVKAKEQLKDPNLNIRIVSMPCQELFREQSEEYKESILPSCVENRIIVEAGSRLSWGEFAGFKGKYVTMDTFGASGKPADLFKEFHLTVEDVIKAIKEF